MRALLQLEWRESGDDTFESYTFGIMEIRIVDMRDLLDYEFVTTFPKGYFENFNSRMESVQKNFIFAKIIDLVNNFIDDDLFDDYGAIVVIEKGDAIYIPMEPDTFITMMQVLISEPTIIEDAVRDQEMAEALTFLGDEL